MHYAKSCFRISSFRFFYSVIPFLSRNLIFCLFSVFTLFSCYCVFPLCHSVLVSESHLCPGTFLECVFANLSKRDAAISFFMSFLSLKESRGNLSPQLKKMITKCQAPMDTFFSVFALFPLSFHFLLTRTKKHDKHSVAYIIIWPL